MVSVESTLHVNRSTFQLNQALKGSGGAISCQDCDIMSFSDETLFDCNVAHVRPDAWRCTLLIQAPAQVAQAMTVARVDSN